MEETEEKHRVVFFFHLRESTVFDLDKRKRVCRSPIAQGQSLLATVSPLVD